MYQYPAMNMNATFCPPMKSGEPTYSTSSEDSLHSAFSYPEIYSSSSFGPSSYSSSSFGDSDMQPTLDPFSTIAPPSPYDYPDLFPFEQASSSTSVIPPPSPLLEPINHPQVQWPSGWEASFIPNYAMGAGDPPPESSSKPTKPFICNCGRSFTRFADLKRHHNSVHFPIFQDCPVEHCSRKGRNGFSRGDHMMEHLRSYHHMDLPKRGASKRAAKGFSSKDLFGHC